MSVRDMGPEWELLEPEPTAVAKLATLFSCAKWAFFAVAHGVCVWVILLFCVAVSAGVRTAATIC